MQHSSFYPALRAVTVDTDLSESHSLMKNRCCVWVPKVLPPKNALRFSCDGTLQTIAILFAIFADKEPCCC